jgi:hypothetical protein
MRTTRSAASTKSAITYTDNHLELVTAATLPPARERTDGRRALPLLAFDDIMRGGAALACRCCLPTQRIRREKPDSARRPTRSAARMSLPCRRDADRVIFFAEALGVGL